MHPSVALINGNNIPGGSLLSIGSIEKGKGISKLTKLMG
jgi:hypothetical protein